MWARVPPRHHARQRTTDVAWEVRNYNAAALARSRDPIRQAAGAPASGDHTVASVAFGIGRCPVSGREILARVSDEVELIGGREKPAIRVVRYDPSWAARFEHERARIAEALGPVAQRIDHIGSTAVAGLCAKPIVDIDVSVEDPDLEASYLPALERAGYRLRVREPGHRMLRSARRDVHVHVCAAGSAWQRRHLLFRDWLRADASDRARYSEVKRQLAGRDWADMNEYAAAKTAVIDEITQRAERWARLTSWNIRA